MGQRQKQIKVDPYKYLAPVEPKKAFSQKAVLFSGLANLAKESGEFFTASAKLQALRDKKKEEKTHEAYTYVTSDMKRRLKELSLEDKADPKAFVKLFKDEGVRKEVSDSLKERTGLELGDKDYDQILKQHSLKEGSYNRRKFLEEFGAGAVEGNPNRYDKGRVIINNEDILNQLKKYKIDEFLSPSEAKKFRQKVIGSQVNLAANDVRTISPELFRREVNRLKIDGLISEETATKAILLQKEQNLKAQKRDRSVKELDDQNQKDSAAVGSYVKGVQSNLKFKTYSGMKFKEKENRNARLQKIHSDVMSGRITHKQALRQKITDLKSARFIPNNERLFMEKSYNTHYNLSLRKYFPSEVVDLAKGPLDTSPIGSIPQSALDFVDDFRIEAYRDFKKANPQMNDFDLDQLYRTSLNITPQNYNSFIRLTEGATDFQKKALRGLILHKATKGSDNLFKESLKELGKNYGIDGLGHLYKYFGEVEPIPPKAPEAPKEPGFILKVIRNVKDFFGGGDKKKEEQPKK